MALSTGDLGFGQNMHELKVVLEYALDRVKAAIDDNDYDMFPLIVGEIRSDLTFAEEI